jgi:predicted RNase H-like nuclease
LVHGVFVALVLVTVEKNGGGWWLVRRGRGRVASVVGGITNLINYSLLIKLMNSME